jgi:hypothetical protein
MPPSSAVQVRALPSVGRLAVRSAQLSASQPHRDGGLEATLSDGSCMVVVWVVNFRAGRSIS